MLNLDNPERCPVWLFKLYQSMCPKQRPANAFYLQPLVSMERLLVLCYTSWAQ